MTRKWKARLAVALLAVAASAGCNPVLLLGHLLDSNDPKSNAKFPLAPRKGHEKEVVRVVVLTSCALSSDPAMMGIDRLLAAEFIQLLEKRCAENKEKVIVLKSKPIDEYKRDNPNWRSMSPFDIGKKFDADYVIDIEVLRISIFEPGSHNQLMRGRAQVSVAAFDLSKPLAEPGYNPPEFPFVYPEAAEVSINDKPATTFRQEFVKHMAQTLVIEFTPHTTRERINLP